MSAKASLPDFSSHPKIIIEFAGAEYIGPQEVPGGAPLHMFRDPVTGSTLDLPESELTIARVQQRMAGSRRAFAVGPVIWRPIASIEEVLSYDRPYPPCKPVILGGRSFRQRIKAAARRAFGRRP